MRSRRSGVYQAFVRRSTLPFAVALCCGLPAALEGQGSGRLVVAPYVGTYGSPWPVVSDSVVRLHQRPALALGLRGNFPLARSHSLEGGAAWTPSVLRETDWSGPHEHVGGVVLGTIRLRSVVARGGRGSWEMFLATGPGVLHRYGAGWEGLEGVTDAALNYGAGLLVRFGHRLAVSLELEGYASRASFLEYSGERRGSGMHSEFVLSLGVPLTLPGR
jgi:hypothetical protein